jgi:hypothetical protein
MGILSQIRRRLSLCIILIVCITNVLIAEQSENKSVVSNNSLHKGSMSLDFRITYRSYLESFSGSIISGKYQYSDKSALRCGLTLNIERDERMRTASTYSAVYDIFSVKMIAQYLRYLSSNKKISSYYALGPTIYFTRYEVNDANRSIQRYIYAGFQINWGVEWFVSKSISLVAEYGASIIFHGWDEDGSYYIGPERPDGFEFSLKSNPVNFGLSVYF